MSAFLLQDISGQVMANIILNASDLLRVDLDGVMVLLPRLFKAIHAILSESTPKIKYVEHKIHITCSRN